MAFLSMMRLDKRAAARRCARAFAALLLGAAMASAWAQAAPGPERTDTAGDGRDGAGDVEASRFTPRELPGGEALHDIPRGEAPRGAWRNLSREQREAIRRLSQEEREALARRAGRPGAVPPGGRLTLQERQELRRQIREEHERRVQRMGPGKRP